MDNKNVNETAPAPVEQGVHNYSQADAYVKPSNPLIQERLEWFQDQKLALMMHWGPYSQLGIVESWALSDKDGEWSRHDVDWTKDSETLKQQYFGLNRSFNPVRFRPDNWADFAADNGFRYLIFTTKHHDGFCMWDTAYTDYKITAEDCPFHTHENADIVRSVFDAFRAKNIGIACYFSKADWHTPYYWNPELGKGQPSRRGPSYIPKDHPELWKEFKTFTKNQLIELCSKYGKLDILWFDAGWVCERAGQDIDLGGIVDEARKIQPWLLSADRTVGGPYENYVTPEQCVPEAPLGVPWESCITVGTQFSFRYEDKYKSPRELVCLLVDIVSKGGNLALNIGPQPDGHLPRGAVESVNGLGAWLKIYGEAIYSTRVCAPYKIGNIAFTRKGDSVYAICLYPDSTKPVKQEILIPYTEKISSVTTLDTGKPVEFQQTSEGLLICQKDCFCGETPIAQVFKLNK